MVDGLLNSAVILSRTGYTAEDGFEIYCACNDAVRLFDIVHEAGKEFDMALCGLGARDTLRLEGAMPLYGHEMDDETLATEIGLNMFIKLDKPDFIGKAALLEKAPTNKGWASNLSTAALRENTRTYMRAINLWDTSRPAPCRPRSEKRLQ